MKNANLPFQMEDKKILNELLEELNLVLKDSDAVAEKDIVKNFLRELSDVTTITVLGNEGVGKTSLLNAIFGGNMVAGSSTQEICEYRYGEKENVFSLDSKTTRYFKTMEALQGLAIVDMPGCNVWKKHEMEESAIDYLNKSDVVIVVFCADSVNDYDVWDVLEKINNKKIVFALSKTDCVTVELLNEAELRLRQYMIEIGVQAPIFKLLLINENISKQEANGLYDLCNFINDTFIGENPTLYKQQENIATLKGMLKELEKSFALRHRQYELDTKVVSNINHAMNSFREKNSIKIEYLKKDIANEIDREMDAYQDEIIRRLNPKQIKERFPNGLDDFMEYLELVNYNYQKRMSTEIEKRTQSYVNRYLTDIQDLYTESIGYFQKRESLMELEDKFYGSLAESKSKMILETSYHLQETKMYYGAITDASEELFLKTWGEREKYDVKVAVGNLGSAGVGAVVGSLIGSLIFSWPFWGVVAIGGVGAIALYEFLGGIFAANSLETMEKRVNECVAEFRSQIGAAKEDMKAQVLSSVEEIFVTELSNADKSFVDFRMSVNIDSKNIPLIESKLEKVHMLMEQIEKMERERMLIC